MSFSYEGVSQPTTILTVDGVAEPLAVSGGSITMDENYSPRIQASLTIPLTGPEQGELIDPRTDQRCTITVGNALDQFTPPRVFNLGIRDRTVDYAQQTMTITAASDEMLLHDVRRLATTTDRNSRDHEGNLYDLVNWGLGVIGAHLQPPLFAAPAITASWDQTNLIFDPRARNATGPVWNFTWGQSGGRAAVAAAPGLTLEAGAVEQVIVSTGPVATTDTVSISPDMAGVSSVTSGRLYTLSGYLSQNAGAARTGRLRVIYYGAESVVLATRTVTKSLPNNTYTKLTVTGVAPEGVESVGLMFEVLGGMPADSRLALAVPVFAEGAENNRWFDKDRPDDDLYIYDGVAGGPSTRVAIQPRPPELFEWEPGQSMFDFLRPFLEATGTRLWCDEQRKWWLDIPRPNDLVDIVGIFGTGEFLGNAVAGTDVISRDRDDYASGVVVKSTWRAANGDRKTSYDIAGDWGKVVLVERDANPGPGIAASMLAAMKNRARTQQLTIVDGQQITPGAAADIHLPGTANQLAHIRRVEIDLATGNATINTTGMETP